MIPNRLFHALLLLLPFWLMACGGVTTNEAPSTDKLIGTPFEGKSSGDALGWSELRSGSFLTSSVDALPIPIFLAYFTQGEENEIMEGINMANTAIGFTAFEIVAEWQNDARAIYKVEQIGDAAAGFPEETFAENPAITLTSQLLFEGKSVAATVIVDWQMELRDDGVDRWIVAHELGHTFGLPHALIDYENDTLLNLEPDSLMQESVFPDNPTLNDYNFMMQKQGEILLRHLGESAS